MSIDLTSREKFDRIASFILDMSTADDVLVRFEDGHSATLRFANNEVIQNVSVRRARVTVEVSVGRRTGRAVANQLTRAALSHAVLQAEAMARLAPDDPEFMQTLGPQRYDDFPTHSPATANAKPMHAAQRVASVIEHCLSHDANGAGVLTNEEHVTGLVSSNDLYAFSRSTSAEFSLTAAIDDGSGWVMAKHRDINSLDHIGRAKTAVEKAARSRSPKRIPAGRYTVILEPAAVAGLVGPLVYSLGARSYHKGTNALSGKLSSAVIDPRLTLRSHPSNGKLLGEPFAQDGLPHRDGDWISKGVLTRLHFDRRTALEHDAMATARPGAIVLDFHGPAAGSVDDLVRETEKGILVTNFWYIRDVNPSNLTITGMTRDGTFLIENGRVVGALHNFRFHESPLHAFNCVTAATAPMESVTLERDKMLLPAMKIEEFNLSSVTEF